MSRAYVVLRCSWWVIALGLESSLAICGGCNSSAHKSIHNDLIGHWQGHINQNAAVKPDVAPNIVHDMTIEADGSCRVRGFLLNVRSDLPPEEYGGYGHWRVEVQAGRQYLLVTTTLAGYLREDKLAMTWTDTGLSLSLEWNDPDLTDELIFIKD